MECPVLNHKMAHMRKTFRKREEIMSLYAKTNSFRNSKCHYLPSKAGWDNNVNVFFAPGIII